MDISRPPPLARQSTIYIPTLWIVYDAISANVRDIEGIHENGIYTHIEFIALMKKINERYEREEKEEYPDGMPVVDETLMDGGISLANLVDWADAIGVCDTQESAYYISERYITNNIDAGSEIRENNDELSTSCYCPDETHIHNTNIMDNIPKRDSSPNTLEIHAMG